jgi:hypothetical protein
VLLIFNFYFVSNKRGEIKNEQSRDTGNKVQKIQNEEKKAKNKTKNKKNPKNKEQISPRLLLTK